MLHIKKRTKHKTSCRQLFFPYIHPQTLGGVNGQNVLFSENGHVAYEIDFLIKVRMERDGCMYLY